MGIISNRIAQKMKEILLRTTLDALSFERVAAWLKSGVEQLKEYAAKTNNRADDWIVNLLERELCDENNVRQWYEYIKSFIVVSYCNQPTYETPNLLPAIDRCVSACGDVSRASVFVGELAEILCDTATIHAEGK